MDIASHRDRALRNGAQHAFDAHAPHPMGDIDVRFTAHVESLVLGLDIWVVRNVELQLPGTAFDVFENGSSCFEGNVRAKVLSVEVDIVDFSHRFGRGAIGPLEFCCGIDVNLVFAFTFTLSPFLRVVIHRLASGCHTGSRVFAI